MNTGAAKRSIKIAVDALMSAMFLYMMSYRAVHGLLYHGICGTALFALIIVHHLLNAAYCRSLFKGKYAARRIVLVAVNSLFGIIMLLMLFSALMMSGEVFSFMPIRMKFWARSLHTAVMAWGFMLMAVHLGLHTRGLLGRLSTALKQRGLAARIAGWLAGAGIGAAGIWSFIKSLLWSDMFLLSGEKIFPPRLWMFYAEYLSIMAAVCLIVYAAAHSAACASGLPARGSLSVAVFDQPCHEESENNEQEREERHTHMFDKEARKGRRERTAHIGRGHLHPHN